MNTNYKVRQSEGVVVHLHGVRPDEKVQWPSHVHRGVVKQWLQHVVKGGKIQPLDALVTDVSHYSIVLGSVSSQPQHVMIKFSNI